jgi:hypothetical protein
MDPTQAPAGTTVLLRVFGSAFQQGDIINWSEPGDVIGTSLDTTFISPGELRAMLSPNELNSPGTRFVRVSYARPNRVCVIGCFTAALTFTITSNFQLTQLIPDRGEVGSTVNLRALGAGFVTSAFLVWRRNGVETPLPTTWVSSAELRTTLTPTLLNSQGIAEILAVNGTNCDSPAVVANLPCPRSNARQFTIEDGLRLTRLDPDRAPTRLVNGVPQDIRLIGNGFAANAMVLWRTGEVVRVLNSAFLSRNELTAQIPANFLTTPGAANLFVRNPGGTEVPSRDSNELPFTIFPVLRLDRIEPPSLPAGSPDTRVSAFGSGFTLGTRIRFRTPAGLAAPDPQTVNVAQGRIDFTMPASLLSQQIVYDVVATDGSLTSAPPIQFVVGVGTPTITLLDPSTRPSGSGPFLLTITGTGFAANAQVLFGGTVLSQPTVTPTRIQVNVPGPLIVNPGDIGVTVRNGTGGPESNRQTFVATGPPVITDLDPRERVANSGDFDLRISGRDFTPSPSVRFGGQPVTVLSATSTEIRARIPNNLLQTAGTVPVIVNVSQRDSNSFNFTVRPGTVVLSLLNPATLPAGSGDFEMTLTGQNMLPNPVVRFNNVEVPIVGVPAATSLRVRVPGNLIQQPGEYTVVVQVGANSAPLPFRVTVPPIPPTTVSSAADRVMPGGNTTALVTLTQSARAAITGRLELTFTPDAAGLPAGFMDPATLFVGSNSKTLDFTIQAGQTMATLPESGRINVGTVAGTVVINVLFLNSLGQNSPTLPEARRITVPRSAPVLTAGSARLVNEGGGVTVEVQGYAPARQMGDANVSFTIAPGTDVLGPTSFPVPVQSAFTTWFASTDGRNNGSRFLLRIPFTIAEGDANRITGFSITLNSMEGPATISGGR